MKTDELIDPLAVGLEPVKPARPSLLLLTAAAVPAVAGVIVLLVVRPDLIQAMGGASPWMKALYTLALTAVAVRLATQLGRPGADVRLAALGLPVKEGRLAPVNTRHSTSQTPIVPAPPVRYLAETGETVRAPKTRVQAQAGLTGRGRPLHPSGA